MEEEIRRKTLLGNAERLAQLPKSSEAGKNLDAFVAFFVAGEKLLISADNVVEVIKYRDVTLLPGVDDKLAGIYNFRGSVIGVFNSDRIFGIDSVSRALHRYLLICSCSDIYFAIVCEDVGGIEHRDPESIMGGESHTLLPVIFSGIFQDSARCVDIDKLMENDILRIL